MRISFPALVVSLATLATAADAATVQSLSGSVMINRGSGYQPVHGATGAKSGDSVVVGPDGSAEIVYADGCRVKVAPGAVTSVLDVSPCSTQGTADTGSSSTGLAVGAAVVAAGVGIALAAGGSGDSKKSASGH